MNKENEMENGRPSFWSSFWSKTWVRLLLAVVALYVLFVASGIVSRLLNP